MLQIISQEVLCHHSFYSVEEYYEHINP